MLTLFNNNSIKTKNCNSILYFNHPVCYMHDGVDMNFDMDFNNPWSFWDPYALHPEVQANIKALENERSPGTPLSPDFTIPADVDYTYGEIIVPNNEIISNLRSLFQKSYTEEPFWLTTIVSDFEMLYHYSISYDHFVNLLEIIRITYRWNHYNNDPYLIDRILCKNDDFHIYNRDPEALQLVKDLDGQDKYNFLIENPHILAKKYLEILEESTTPLLPHPALHTLLPMANLVFVSGLLVGVTAVTFMFAKESSHMYSPHEFDFMINLNIFAQVIKILCILQIPLWLLIMYKLRYYYYFRFKLILRKLWN